jgi:hypothetical protein
MAFAQQRFLHALTPVMSPADLDEPLLFEEARVLPRMGSCVLRSPNGRMRSSYSWVTARAALRMLKDTQPDPSCASCPIRCWMISRLVFAICVPAGCTLVALLQDAPTLGKLFSKIWVYHRSGFKSLRPRIVVKL